MKCPQSFALTNQLISKIEKLILPIEANIKSLLVRNYTDYNPGRLGKIYKEANFKVLVLVLFHFFTKHGSYRTFLII
jgi:hypothetical protein